jgi:hypothetical protein
MQQSLQRQWTCRAACREVHGVHHLNKRSALPASVSQGLTGVACCSSKLTLHAQFASHAALGSQKGGLCMTLIITRLLLRLSDKLQSTLGMQVVVSPWPWTQPFPRTRRSSAAPSTTRPA